MTDTPEQRLAAWKRLKRAKHLTDSVADCLCTWTTLGFSLERITEAGSTEDSRLLAAQENELPTVTGVTASGRKVKQRPPSKRMVIAWLSQGEEDASAGRETDKSKFARRLAHARENASSAAYDQIIEIERRMVAPRLVKNPEYNAEDKNSKPMIVNPYWLDSTTGSALIRSIQWRLSKLKPEKYGERIDINAKIAETKSVTVHAPDWLQSMIGDRAQVTAQQRLTDARTPQDVVVEQADNLPDSVSD